MAQVWQTTLVDVLGWVSFASWSISFYGQIYINFRIKSVQGMNFDFVAMNLSGFIFYSLYNTYGYFVDSEQTGQVLLSDLLFGYHALLATLITVSQIAIYPKKDNRIRGITLFGLLVVWLFIVVYSTLTLETKTFEVDSRLGIISMLGYFKLGISVLKYMPQFYWNMKRKSTKGWSIFNIMMDFTGGACLFLTQALQAAFGIDFQVNIVKIVLGAIVVCFDISFMVQHYCLYPEKKHTKVQQTSDSDEDKPESLVKDDD